MAADARCHFQYHYVETKKMYFKELREQNQ